MAAPRRHLRNAAIASGYPSEERLEKADEKILVVSSPVLGYLMPCYREWLKFHYNSPRWLRCGGYTYAICKSRSRNPCPVLHRRGPTVHMMAGQKLMVTGHTVEIFNQLIGTCVLRRIGKFSSETRCILEVFSNDKHSREHSNNFEFDQMLHVSAQEE